MRVLVTGAAGFIGRDFCRWLTSYGERCVLVDDMKLFLKDPATTLHGVSYDDVVPPEQASKYVPLVDCVVHLGALSSTGESDLTALVENNITYSKFLIDTAKTFSKPIVFVSSAGVYGNMVSKPETSLLEPITAYGVSKAIVDNYVVNCVKSDKAVVVRPFNVYGPGEYTKPTDSQSLLYKIAFCVARRTQFVYHTPDASRDFVYVGDVSIALRNIVKRLVGERNKQNVYDIGTGVAPTVKEIIEHAIEKYDLWAVEWQTTKSTVGYQKHTKATVNDADPFTASSFLSWQRGLDMLVHNLKGV